MEYVIYFGYFVALLVLVSAVGILIKGALHFGSSRENSALPLLLTYPILIVVALTTIFGGRDLSISADIIPVLQIKHPIVIWFSRLTNLFILLFSLERIVRYVFNPRSERVGSYWLLIAYLVFYATNLISPLLFGYRSFFANDQLYMLFVGVAVILATSDDMWNMIRHQRNALALFVFFSFIVLVVNPSMVTWSNYQGLIPGLSLRFSGLSNHPNVMGPLMVILLLLLFVKPFSNSWINRIVWVLGLAGLLLAQSKTAWLATLAALTYLTYTNYRQQVVERFFDFRRPALAASILSALMLILLVASAFIMFGKFSFVDQFLLTREGSDLLTMTGRTDIWQIALREWQLHPLFGYGLSLFDDFHRMQYALPAAVHAHSQFYQVLASAGVIGVFGLIFYMATLLILGIKVNNSSMGLSIALLIVISFRSVSEVPLALHGLGLEQVVQLLLLMVIAGSLRHIQATSTI
ncbi:O-antigen ligase family protein [Deefgea piscis]|uniref:O-antigen ligase family protein n=1 Tax=Deefgea piscis TaxID=2739061 RepID=UPI002107AB63|nr:O-antigen ligase family protein [Deefgea piscis]